MQGHKLLEMQKKGSNAVIQALVVAVLYVFTGNLGFLLAITPGNVTAVWPPSGVAVAALLLAGTPCWFGIWLGSFSVNMLFFTNLSSITLAGIASTFAIASGSTIQALAAFYFLRKQIKDNSFLNRPQDAFLFIVISASCCLIASTVGVSSLWLAGFVPNSDFAYTWLTWWAGDTAGLLVFTPLLLTWRQLPSFLKIKKNLIEFAIFLLLLIGCCWTIFGDSYFGRHHYPLLFSVFPLLIWAAARFGMSGVTIALPIIEIFAIIGIKQGSGPLVLGTMNESLIVLAVFMSTMLLIGLTFARVLGQWQNFRQRLEDTAQELEAKVIARTTELEEANRNLLLARDQSIEASNIKSAFVANISHELRTPLSGILGTTELLLSKKLDEKTSSMIEILHESGTGLLKIVNDMLDLSKIEAGRMTMQSEPFSPAFLVQDCSKLLSSTAIDKKLKLNISLDTQLPQFVYGDAARIRQTLLNLIGNAIKFTDQGYVMVSANLESEDDHAVTIRFLVKDTGIGIEQDKQNVLFMPFSQVDSTSTRRFGGTGLGLAISKRLIAIMGGQIGFESEFKAGSTFWFTVPFEKLSSHHPGADGGGVIIKPSVDPLPADLTQNKIILVVEDSPLLRKITSSQLSTLGLQCVIVDDGSKGVDEFKTGKYDLILMDIHLPDINGYQACAFIRELESERGVKPQEGIPIIAITAGAMEGDREAALNAGLDDYLAKPVSIDDLRVMLARWLVKRRAIHMKFEKD